MSDGGITAEGRSALSGRSAVVLASSELAVYALWLLGLTNTETNTTWAFPSIDATGDPDYPSDVTDDDPADLLYTDNGAADKIPPNTYPDLWNNYEGGYWAWDGTTGKYWTVFPNNGPFVGTGADVTEKDKSARYQMLDKIRDDQGANFYQKRDAQGAKLALP